MIDRARIERMLHIIKAFDYGTTVHDYLDTMGDWQAVTTVEAMKPLLTQHLALLAIVEALAAMPPLEEDPDTWNLFCRFCAAHVPDEEPMELSFHVDLCIWRQARELLANPIE